MCTPTAAAIASVAGTAVQIKGAKDQGKMSKQIADMNAKQSVIDFEQSKLEASQFANARLESLDKAMEVNNAMFGFMGRDNDASIQAFRKSEQDIAYRDVERGITQQVIAGGQALGQANQEIMRGKSALATSKIQTASMLSSGIYQLTQIDYKKA